MGDDTLGATVSFQEADALNSLEQIMTGYGLPGVYNEILTSHWIDLASNVLELYGEDSDNWRRMIWFSKIVCKTISASLERGDTEPLDGALKTFMTWLGLCNQETGALDIALVAAQHLGKRLVNQVTADIGEGEPGATDTEDTLANQASALAPVPSAEPPPQSEPMSEPEVEPTELAPESVSDLEEDSTELEPESMLDLEVESMELEPESMLDLEVESMELEAEPLLELEEEHTEPEQALTPAAESAVATASNVPVSAASDQTINTTTGSNFMNIPSLTESPDAERQNGTETSQDGGSRSTDRRGRRKPPKGPSPIVPIGVWLGFHDEDLSTMAKLAVYDRANENYIFANKHGFLARQLSKAELLDMIEDELVDIIERRLVTSTAPAS